MRSHYFLPLMLMACLLLPACQQADSKDVRPALAVVDMSRIMRDSEPGKAGVKFLEGIQSKMQEELNAVQDKLEKDPTDEKVQQELQQLYMKLQQRIQIEQQNVANKLYDMVQRVLNAYREQQGFAVMIAADVAASYSPSVDVTNAVIAEVNKQDISFTAVADTVAPAPESPAADDKEDTTPGDTPTKAPAEAPAQTPAAEKPADQDKAR